MFFLPGSLFHLAKVELRARKIISNTFRLVLLHANCVAKPRRSLGYAYVWRLVSAQNYFLYSVSLIIFRALSAYPENRV